MKFVVDAQLPLRLARHLSDHGHDAIHSLQLPQGNRTSDAELAETADSQGRVMLTKDRDFEIGHLVHGSPRNLLLVTTGNIGNDALVHLFTVTIGLIEIAFDQGSFVELSSTAVIVHAG